MTRSPQASNTAGIHDVYATNTQSILGWGFLEEVMTCLDSHGWGAFRAGRDKDAMCTCLAHGTLCPIFDNADDAPHDWPFH